MWQYVIMFASLTQKKNGMNSCKQELIIGSILGYR